MHPVLTDPLWGDYHDLLVFTAALIALGGARKITPHHMRILLDYMGRDAPQSRYRPAAVGRYGGGGSLFDWASVRYALIFNVG